MKNIMILTLGNRDIQFKSKDFGTISNDFFKLFAMNTEGDKENYIINKAKSAEKTFREVAKLVFENLNIFDRFIIFPMLEGSLAHLEENNLELEKIVLTTSKQAPIHHQDCDYFALIMKRWLEQKGIACELEFSSHNPNNFEEMTDFYAELYDSYESAGNIIVSNSGGTPNMRSASHFAALFRGYQFITLSSEDKKNISNYGKQERLVLSKMAKSMLDVFDYEGIRQLPHGNERISQLASYAIARIALDKKSVLKISKELNDKDLQFPESPSYEFFEKEIILSALIKFEQSSYGDYLWRLFTFKENVFIPHVEKLLGGKVIFNRKNEHEDWNNLLSCDPELYNYLSSAKIGKTRLFFEAPSPTVYEKIVHFYVKKTTGEKYDKPSFYIIRPFIDKLSDLRNDIAHRYEGISKEIIDDVLLKNRSSAHDFNHKLRDYIHVADGFDVYDSINEKIMHLLL